MTDFQLLIWRGREVTGASVSDAKGACVVVAMADTSPPISPCCLLQFFDSFFRPLSLPPAQTMRRCWCWLRSKRRLCGVRKWGRLLQGRQATTHGLRWRDYRNPMGGHEQRMERSRGEDVLWLRCVWSCVICGVFLEVAECSVVCCGCVAGRGWVLFLCTRYRTIICWSVMWVIEGVTKKDNIFFSPDFATSHFQKEIKIKYAHYY